MIVANPVTAVLRELGSRGHELDDQVRPRALPAQRAGVRLGVLQGLLDSDGGPVTQRGRTCRVEYTTCSERLARRRRFPRPLARRRRLLARATAEGRTPGLAHGRPVHHRSDAYILDIRLPAGSSRFGWLASASSTRARRRAADALHRLDRAGG